MARQIHEIARDIRKEWKNPNYAADPYLSAMFNLDTIDDNFGLDSAKDIIIRFLCNASSFRGGNAKTLKQELKSLAGIK